MLSRRIAVLLALGFSHAVTAQTGDESRVRARDMGLAVGVMAPGPRNAITDVPGVTVGQTTIIRGDSVRTGVTAVLPHAGNIYQEKVPGAIYLFNAFGKLAGYTQVAELGNIETPIVLTNTLNVGTGVLATIKYILSQPENDNVRSVNAVVGETNDGYLNDIRGQHVTEQDVIAAIKSASSGSVAEGSVGAGTGTRALGYKGGIGTSSRLVASATAGSYTVGVLVQSNFGRELVINGVPFSRELHAQTSQETQGSEEGSCMIVIATDAPLSPRNLLRLAKRSFSGMARTTTVMTNGSGDYAIAFSTAYHIPNDNAQELIVRPAEIANDDMNPFFQAVEEATQEAIYNSIFMATTVAGYHGHTVPAIPLGAVKRICEKYNMLDLNERLPLR